MTENNPFKNNFKKMPKTRLNLDRLKEIDILGETAPPKTALTIKKYNTSFTALITKETRDKIMQIKNHPDPDKKRSLGIIIEQAVDLYLTEKGIKL